MVIELSSNRPERTEAGARMVAERVDLAGAAAGVAGAWNQRELVVESARPLPSAPARPGTRWLVRFAGLHARDAADALRGAMLLGEPIPDDEVLWVHELVGSTVVDEDGVELGVVTGLLANPASDLLELADGSLVPLVFVRGRSPGRVVVDVPPGLIG